MKTTEMIEGYQIIIGLKPFLYEEFKKEFNKKIKENKTNNFPGNGYSDGYSGALNLVNDILDRMCKE